MITPSLCQSDLLGIPQQTPQCWPHSGDQLKPSLLQAAALKIWGPGAPQAPPEVWVERLLALLPLLLLISPETLQCEPALAALQQENQVLAQQQLAQLLLVLLALLLELRRKASLAQQASSAPP